MNIFRCSNLDELCSRPEKCCTVSFCFCKIDPYTLQGIAGAIFQLFCRQTVIATAVSDANGRVCFCDIPVGCYALSEVTPPTGYQPERRTFPVLVESNGNVLICGTPSCCFSVYNIPENTAILDFVVYKRDSTAGTPLSGAVFELRNGTTVVQTVTSDTNGTALFPRLTPGTYTLVETQAPEGYQINPTPHTVTVSQNGSIIVDGQTQGGLTIPNNPVAVPLAFTVRNSTTNQPLGGAEFTLYSGTTQIGRAVSDTAGNVNFTAVQSGTYRLRETNPPIGYRPDTTAHTVEVSPTGIVTIDTTPAGQFVINKDTYPSSFAIRKTNPGGTVLPGAEFQLTQGETQIQTHTTDTEGYAYFESLAAGTYTLTETQAPSGYQLITTEYPVIVDADGTVTINGTVTTQLNLSNEPLLTITANSVDQATATIINTTNYTVPFGGNLTIDAPTLPDYTLVSTTPINLTNVTTNQTVQFEYQRTGA